MSGMPSARGSEMKGNDSLTNYQRGFNNIPRNPDGTMIIDPQHDPKPVEEPKPPRCCNDCTLIGNCDASCALGSEQCKRMLGL